MCYFIEKSILNKNLKRVNYLMEFSLLLPLLRSCLQLVSCGNYQESILYLTLPCFIVIVWVAYETICSQKKRGNIKLANPVFIFLLQKEPKFWKKDIALPLLPIRKCVSICILLLGKQFNKIPCFLFSPDLASVIFMYPTCR